MEDMDLFEAMYSQRSFTRFRPDPVPKEAIDKIIEAATRAPSGANRQHWEFIAITDPDVVAQVGNVYREVWLGLMGHEPRPDETPVYRAARYLANHMPEVPAMVLACVDHSQGYAASNPGEPIDSGKYASSIWPAIQNLFLAARALGLGTRLTTAHLRGEQRVKDILGIPEHVETVMLTPLGVPPRQLRPHATATNGGSYVLQSLREQGIKDRRCKAIKRPQPLKPSAGLWPAAGRRCRYWCLDAGPKHWPRAGWRHQSWW